MKNNGINSIIDDLLKKSINKTIIFGIVIIAAILIQIAYLSNPKIFEDALNSKPYSSYKEKKDSIEDHYKAKDKVTSNLQIAQAKYADLSLLTNYIKTENNNDTINRLRSVLSGDNARYIRVNDIRGLSGSKDNYSQSIIDVNIVTNGSEANKKVYYVVKFHQWSSNENSQVEIFNKEISKEAIPDLKLAELNNYSYRYELVERFSMFLSDEDYSNLLRKLNEELSKELIKSEDKKNLFYNTLIEHEKDLENIIARTQSDNIYFTIKLTQRVLVTLVLVTVAFYFLRGIGGELLFSRRLSMIKVAINLYDPGEGKLEVTTILQLYESFAGQEEKSGVAPATELGNVVEALKKVLSEARDNIKKKNSGNQQ